MLVQYSTIKKLFAFGLLFAMASPSTQAQSPQASKLLEDAVVLQDRLLNALIADHDVDQARDFYDDQFVLTTSSGKAKSKTDLLSEIGSSDLDLEINETSDVVVRVRNETAVLTATLHQRGSYKGKAFDANVRVTDTWILLDGKWRILAGHASRL